MKCDRVSSLCRAFSGVKSDSYTSCNFFAMEIVTVSISIITNTIMIMFLSLADVSSWNM